MGIAMQQVNPPMVDIIPITNPDIRRVNATITKVKPIVAATASGPIIVSNNLIKMRVSPKYSVAEAVNNAKRNNSIKITVPPYPAKNATKRRDSRSSSRSIKAAINPLRNTKNSETSGGIGIANKTTTITIGINDLRFSLKTL